MRHYDFVYDGERVSHKGQRATVINAKCDWVEEEYMLLSVDLEYDSGKIKKNVDPMELVDDLRFLNPCHGWNHGYSSCKVYGITKEQFLKHILSYSDWEQVFYNGQEEADGSISFDAYRAIPDDIVELFSSVEGCFVLAWWHWDGDMFACSKAEEINVTFDREEEGDEPEWTLADITVMANGKYTISFGASDFEEEEIEFYKKLAA